MQPGFFSNLNLFALTGLIYENRVIICLLRSKFPQGEVPNNMKRFWSAVRRFFAPPPNSPTLARIAPYVVVAFLVVVLFAFSAAAWEYTNQTKFCGLTCHTMPPEYQTQQRSAHANVTLRRLPPGAGYTDCDDSRARSTYSWQTGSAMVLGTFQLPDHCQEYAPGT